jgi:Ca-activated chloride channel family protein
MHRPNAVRLAPPLFVTPRLSRWLPAALALLGALLPACTPDPTGDDLRTDENFASNRFLRAIARPDFVEEPPPEDQTNTDDQAAGTGQRHKGEEGKMGRPTSKAKSGLYAMKGPKDAIPQMARNFDQGGHYLASPYGGAFAVGNDDADVWGGLTGTEIGQAYGVGGLGLVGSGAGDSYKALPEAPWSLTHAAPLSTFSIDVDTASYSNVRRFLLDGWLPPPDAVRVEEMINYFSYAYPQPEGPHPLAVGAEVAPCPWKPGHQLVRVHLQGKTVEAKQVPARNLVFLVDVSGSMGEADKLPLVQKGLEMLTDQLRPEDKITLVTYAGRSGIVLQPTSGERKDDIRRAIRNLGAGGGTNGASGIVQAYAEAHNHFVKGGINRVILATDGDFNVGITDHDDLIKLIEKERETGVFLTVLGVGRGNLEDHTMEQLADKGNGNYAYLDSEKEARRVLVAEASGTLVAVAKDVKFQVEWNPARVAGYRLVGYENRTLTAEAFNDDTKDAGELGAGDSVTALYEVVPAGRPVPGARIDGLKYTRPAGHADGELLTVKVRYKQPDGTQSTKLELPVDETVERFADASPQLRLAASVAALGLKLRRSPAVESLELHEARGWAERVQLPDPDGHRAELLRLFDRARDLLARETVHSATGAR